MTTTAEPTRADAIEAADVEHVVLVDPLGRAVGVLPKVEAHHGSTPLHLAFSCHIVRPDGSVLLTQRAASKTTWPSVWTNGCCGHPQLGETLRVAAHRRIGQELGLRSGSTKIALADFVYRSVMANGTAEHELCPVLIVEADGPTDPAPEEVRDIEWVSWYDLVERVRDRPESLSPWCVEQVNQLLELGSTPLELLHAERDAPVSGGLDVPIQLGEPSAIAPLPLADVSDCDGVDPLGAVARPLRRVLGHFLDERAQELCGIAPGLAEMAQEIRGLVDAGGKRLRPAFVYWGHRATGAVSDPAVLRPAAAVELLHTFALLHDDVMDRSLTRRGRPTAHVAFEDHHRRTAATGDPGWFGTSAAILAGDMAFVWADELFDSTELAPDLVDGARRVFSELRTEVIAGQYLDLTLAGDVAAPEARARQVAVLKSARYTVTRPLLLGAALAGPVAPELQAALTRYGDAVGLAFQMRDDVLGVFGDPDTTGKGRLDDLREGKRTVLTLRALRLADPTGREVLSASLGDAALDERGAERCRDVISASGARASIERLIADRHAEAVAVISDLDTPARRALERLAASAIERRT